MAKKTKPKGTHTMPSGMKMTGSMKGMKKGKGCK